MFEAFDRLIRLAYLDISIALSLTQYAADIARWQHSCAAASKIASVCGISCASSWLRESLPT